MYAASTTGSTPPINPASSAAAEVRPDTGTAQRDCKQPSEDAWASRASAVANCDILAARPASALPHPAAPKLAPVAPAPDGTSAAASTFTALGASALAEVGALTRAWDMPLYLTSNWFHFLGEGLATTDKQSAAAPLVAAAVLATPVVFPVTFFADALNTLAYPAKIAARFLAQDPQT